MGAHQGDYEEIDREVQDIQSTAFKLRELCCVMSCHLDHVGKQNVYFPNGIGTDQADFKQSDP